MLADEPVTQTRDHAPDALVAARFDSDVALGVESHRPVAEVGRPHAAKLVVDDEHLAVHVQEMRHLEPRYFGVVKTIATAGVGLVELLVEARAQDAHRALFEPAFFGAARDNNDFRALPAAQPPRQRRADDARAEILVLQIHRALRRIDRVDVEVPYLVHGRVRRVTGIGA
jgi:hypothetical protein